MLVLVTERTREIGIRRAIGAPRSAIMKQFLLESTLLAGASGLLCALLGVTLILTGANVARQLTPLFGSPTLSPLAIAVAIAVSLGIGLLAGGYPRFAPPGCNPQSAALRVAAAALRVAALVLGQMAQSPLVSGALATLSKPDSLSSINPVQTGLGPGRRGSTS